MKYRQIMSGVLVLTPVCIALKLLHMLRMTDGSTGFVKYSYSVQSGLVLFALAAFMVVSLILGATVRRSPVKMPESKLLGLSSIVVGAALVAEFFLEEYPIRVPSWQITLLSVFGALAAVVFLVYGALLLFKIKIPTAVFIVPVVYAMAKLLLLFTESSSVALIIDNAVSILSQGAIMVFLLSLAKQANGVASKNLHKLLLCSGIATIQTCLVGAVPSLVMRFMKPSFVQHESLVSNLVTLIFGLFALVFVFEFFSNNNLSERPRKTSAASSSSNRNGISYFSTLPEEAVSTGEAVDQVVEVVPQAAEKEDKPEVIEQTNPFKVSLFKEEGTDEDDTSDFSRVILE